MEKLETLKKWVKESNRIVFFGGAGVSTESGVPDFRSPGGIYDTGEVGTNAQGSTESYRLVNRRGRIRTGA